METISRNLEALTAFHVVACEGSFTKASVFLGRSKSQLSKLVKQLEVQLSAHLFYRTTRTLNLTEEGNALFAYTTKIFELSNEASRCLRDLSKGTTGLIRITAPLTVGDALFPDLLSSLKDKIPGVKFELDLSNHPRDLAKEGIDFAIRASDSHPSDFVVKPLGRIKDVVCATPDFLKLGKVRRNDPKGLMNLNCIRQSHDNDWNRWNLQSEGGDVEIDVTGSYAANQYTTARLLCLQSLGAARLPLFIVKDDLASGRLIDLLPDFQLFTHTIHLVYLATGKGSKKHTIAKEAIVSWFKGKRDFFF